MTDQDPAWRPNPATSELVRRLREQFPLVENKKRFIEQLLADQAMAGLQVPRIDPERLRSLAAAVKDAVGKRAAVLATYTTVEDILADHEMDYASTNTSGVLCTCGWTGTSDEASGHARDVGLCGDCWGSGEGTDVFASDSSGIGTCSACGGGGTAGAEDALDAANKEIDDMHARWEAFERDAFEPR